MLPIQQLAVLTLVSSVLAIPHRGNRKHAIPPNCEVQDRVVVCTVTVTAGQPAPTSAPAPPPSSFSTAAIPTPDPTPLPSPTPDPIPSPVPSPSPSPVAAGGSSSGDDSGNNGSGGVANLPQSVGQDDYMSIVNPMRVAAGLPEMTKDGQLEANALKTAQLDVSMGQMHHELYPGSFGQVIATGGTPNNFRDKYIKSWLCENPSIPGLEGLCDPGQGDPRTSSPDHSDILTNAKFNPNIPPQNKGKYTKIGCALAGDYWICDVA